MKVNTVGKYVHLYRSRDLMLFPKEYYLFNTRCIHFPFTHVHTYPNEVAAKTALRMLRTHNKGASNEN